MSNYCDRESFDGMKRCDRPARFKVEGIWMCAEHYDEWMEEMKHEEHQQ